MIEYKLDNITKAIKELKLKSSYNFSWFVPWFGGMLFTLGITSSPPSDFLSIVMIALFWPIELGIIVKNLIATLMN